jgi:hypothetical protein
MKLNGKALGVALGLVWGVALFLVTNISLLRGGGGGTLGALSQVYIGYSFSFFGSIIGMLWGFVSMFVAGWLVAWLYNKFSAPRAPVSES